VASRVGRRVQTIEAGEGSPGPEASRVQREENAEDRGIGGETGLSEEARTGKDTTRNQLMMK
jgi:hypothetical protein